MSAGVVERGNNVLVFVLFIDAVAIELGTVQRVLDRLDRLRLDCYPAYHRHSIGNGI